tara:strand:- start:5420 stop:5716 length:297 start_codon:yes stop_codon:yes gene_type:complete
MGALKVNNVQIVNSTANIQSAVLPTISGVTGTYGSGANGVTLTVDTKGLATVSANNDLTTQFTKRTFDGSQDAAYSVTISTGAPSGGADGDIHYQTYS